MRISEATFIVVDTETTGTDKEKDRVVEIAMRRVRDGASFSTLVNPGMPIPVTASAIHHITDDDVCGYHPYEHYIERFATMAADTVFVAHNAEFDRSFLKIIGLRDRWVCTMRVAHHLFPDAPGFSNQTLRYHFGGANLDLHGEAPHRAMADTIVTEFIFKKLLAEYQRRGYDDDVESLIAFSAQPINYTTMPFGQHKGKRFTEIPDSYIDWAISPRGITDDADLRFTFITEKNRRARK